MVRIVGNGGMLNAEGLAHIAARDNKDFLTELPERSMKLIVTSPPYNIGKTYETRTSLEAYLAEQAQVLAACSRVLHDEGSIFWQVGNHITPDGEVVPLDIVLYPLFKQHGLILRNRIIWHFEHGLHCKKRFSGRHETILWFTKGSTYTFNLDDVRVPAKYPHKKHFKGPKIGEISGNPLGGNPGDMWIIPNVKSNHCEKTEHPCQFPIELVERLVLAMTDEGDAVLDPYMGVGISVIAAIKHDRQGYGCDIVPRYVDIARERIAELAKGTLRMRPMDRPVYDPSLPGGGQKSVEERSEGRNLQLSFC